MAERNVLITGGNGYIGSRFLQCLIKEPLMSVTSVARGNALKKDNTKHYATVYSDLNNKENYLSELNKAEYIVWFAANRKHFIQYNSLYDDNVRPIVRVLPALKKSINLKVFIYISSISAIDNLPYTGNPIYNERAPRPATPYGLTKLLAEKHVRKSGIPYITLRLPFMYGSEFKAYSHLWFWKKLAYSSLLSRVHFAGKLSLLHIDDFARIVKSYIEGGIHLEKNTEHTLGDYETYKVNDVVDNIRELHGLHTYRREIESSDFLKVATKILPITSLKYWSRVLVDEHYFTAEPTQDASLSDFDFISLREGLAETYSIKASNKII